MVRRAMGEAGELAALGAPDPLPDAPGSSRKEKTPTTKKTNKKN
jgi:hypothetical protein